MFLISMGLGEAADESSGCLTSLEIKQDSTASSSIVSASWKQEWILLRESEIAKLDSPPSYRCK